MTTQPLEAIRAALKAEWRLASDNELPATFSDPRINDFKFVCSNGFEGDASLGSAFIHGPHNWPQCFPDGEDGDCSCTVELLKRMQCHE